jgi:adenosylcobinamide kinase/adenosylcobinamide-phosphate guanylyltransferase
MLPPLTLVLGGARSGKSAFAEGLLAGQTQPLYIATCQIYDDEMAERVRIHQSRRPAPWVTVEEPLDLAGALLREAQPGRAVLVDCLTLWVSNLMMAGQDVPAAINDLCARLTDLTCPVVFVANEVGLGIVPDNALARSFRDHAGRLNQSLAAICQKVAFVAAGLPLMLKDTP